MQLTQKIKLDSLILLFLSMFQKIIEFLTIIVLSRLLQPEEFGQFGLAFAINGLIAVVGSLGIGLYVVYEKTVSQSLLSFAFWLNLIVSFILMLMAIALAKPLEVYFEIEGLSPILYLLALSIFFNACGVIHLAILQKNLNFKTIGFIQATITICGSLLSIFLAIDGWGVYSFVLPVVLNSVLLSLCYWIFQKWRPDFRFDFSHVKPIFNYGKHIFTGDVHAYLIQNVAYLVIAKFLTIQALGYFKFSFSLAMAFVLLFHDLANKLIMPLYAYLKQNSELVREVVVRIFQYLTFFSVPAFTGMILVAPDLVRIVFGEKWIPAIPALRILCMMGMFVVISRPIPAILNAFGRPDIRSVYSLIFLPLLILLLLLTVSGGFELFVSAYTLANILFVLVMFVRTMHIIELRGWKVIKQLGFILMPVFIMIMAVASFKILPELRFESDLMNLFIQIGVGIAAFVLSFRFINKKSFEILYRPIVDLRKMETI